jgi:acetyl-CoA C-acetyltransferase
MAETYIVSAVRTPIGKFGGGLKDVSPVDLAAHVMKAAVARANVDPARLDQYIFGNILKHGHGQLLPRHAAIKAGIPVEVDGYAVDMLCSSGMMSTMNGATAIRAGEADLVLTGGVESMSQAGFLLTHKARWGYKLLIGEAKEHVVDALLIDGLTDPITGELMGEETERLCADQKVTRTELDEVAYLSNSRAAAAEANGKFKAEVAPVEIQVRRKPVVINHEEGIRADTTLESLLGAQATSPAQRRRCRQTVVAVRCAGDVVCPERKVNPSAWVRRAYFKLGGAQATSPAQRRRCRQTVVAVRCAGDVVCPDREVPRRRA